MQNLTHSTSVGRDRVTPLSFEVHFNFREFIQHRYHDSYVKIQCTEIADYVSIGDNNARARSYRRKNIFWYLRHSRSRKQYYIKKSLNYTSAAFLKHHTIDIMFCYGAPHVSSVGSIDDRDSTFVAKMSVVKLKFSGESKDLQSGPLKKNLHITSGRPALKI